MKLLSQDLESGALIRNNADQDPITQLTFEDSDGNTWQIIDSNRQGGGLDIRLIGPSTAMRVLPVVSNVVCIQPVNREF